MCIIVAECAPQGTCCSILSIFIFVAEIKMRVVVEDGCGPSKGARSIGVGSREGGLWIAVSQLSDPVTSWSLVYISSVELFCAYKYSNLN